MQQMKPWSILRRLYVTHYKRQRPSGLLPRLHRGYCHYWKSTVCCFGILSLFLLNHSSSCQSRAMQCPVPCPCHSAYSDIPPLRCFWHRWILSWARCNLSSSDPHEFLRRPNYPRTWSLTPCRHLGKHGIECCSVN